MVLYGINEKIYSITNPTDYTVTLQVYANVDSSNRVWMPNFQFHYEYCQGTVAQNCNNWAWGTKTFDMNTGCNNYDNQGHSQTNMPGFYWRYNCNDASQCAPAVKPVTTTSYRAWNGKSTSTYSTVSSNIVGSDSLTTPYVIYEVQTPTTDPTISTSTSSYISMETSVNASSYSAPTSSSTLTNSGDNLLGQALIYQLL